MNIKTVAIFPNISWFLFSLELTVYLQLVLIQHLITLVVTNCTMQKRKKYSKLKMR